MLNVNHEHIPLQNILVPSHGPALQTRTRVGSIVESFEYTSNKIFYEFSHQPSGLYYFQFYDNDRLLYSGKISLIKTN